jgi:glucose dehydrogenase
VDHDYRGQRYTPLDQITAKNAADLAPVCSYTFPDKEPSQTAPIAYDGILYATTAHHTVAVDGASCGDLMEEHRCGGKPKCNEATECQGPVGSLFCKTDDEIAHGSPLSFLQTIAMAAIDAVLN